MKSASPINKLFLAFSDDEPDFGLDFSFGAPATGDEAIVIDGPENDKDKSKAKETPAKKTAKPKEDQIRDIANQRDSARAEVLELKKQLESLKGSESLSKVKSIAEHIAKKSNKTVAEITEEDVNAYIKRSKDRKEQLALANSTIKEKDKQLKEFNIEASDEWKSEYMAPLNKSGVKLLTVLDQVDANGKSKHPEFTNDIAAKLGEAVDTNGEIDYKKVRRLVDSYKDLYRAKYEDEPSAIPTFSEVSSLLETYVGLQLKASNAKKNWEAERRALEDQKSLLAAQDQEKRIKAEESAFIYVSRKLNDEFDPEKWNVTEDKYKSLVKEAIDNRIQSMKGAVKPLSASSFISMSVKAKCFDEAIDRIRKLEARLKLATGKVSEEGALEQDFEEGDELKSLGAKFGFGL